MIFSFKLTITCFIIGFHVIYFEAKPFEVSDENFVYVNTQDALGNYNFSYEDSEQLTNRTEMGKIVKTESDKTTLVVNGSYSTAFDLGDCQTIVVKYESDEKGFRAQFSYREKVIEIKTENGTIINITTCPVYKAPEKQPEISSNCIATLANSCPFG